MANQPRRMENTTKSLNGFGKFLLVVSWLAFAAGIVFMFVLPIYNVYKTVHSPSFDRILSGINISRSIFVVSATIFLLCFSARIKNPKESAGTNIVSGIWSAIACVLLTYAYSFLLEPEYNYASLSNLDPDLAIFYGWSKFFILTTMSFVLCNVYGSKLGVFVHNVITEGVLYRGEGIKKLGKGEKTFVFFLVIGILLSLTIRLKYFFHVIWFFNDYDSSIVMYLLYIQIITLAIVFRANSRKFGVIEENLYCAFEVINFTSICIYYIVYGPDDNYLLTTFICALVIALLVLVHLPARKTHIAGLSNWMIVFLALSALIARYIMNQYPYIPYYEMMDKTLMVPSILISAIALKNVLLRLTKFR